MSNATGKSKGKSGKFVDFAQHRETVEVAGALLQIPLRERASWTKRAGAKCGYWHRA
jgi:hypothetical protein